MRKGKDSKWRRRRRLRRRKTAYRRCRRICGCGSWPCSSQAGHPHGGALHAVARALGAPLARAVLPRPPPPPRRRPGGAAPVARVPRAAPPRPLLPHHPPVQEPPTTPRHGPPTLPPLRRRLRRRGPPHRRRRSLRELSLHFHLPAGLSAPRASLRPARWRAFLRLLLLPLLRRLPHPRGRPPPLARLG